MSVFLKFLNVRLIFSILFLTAAYVVFGFSNLNTFAQQIVPSQPSSNDPFAKSWFIETLKPGDKKTLSANIQNPENRDMKLQIMAKDSTTTKDGVFTYIATEEKNKQVGSWISLSQTEISLKAGESKMVDFEVQIPENTLPGEYAGVVAVQEMNPSSNNSTFLVQQRIGARIYITVPGEFSVSPKMLELNPLLPEQNGYDEYVKAYYNDNFDKVYIRSVLDNSGNVFAKFLGKVELQTPSKLYSQDFNRDFSPNTEGAEILLSFSLENGSAISWEVGKYTVKYNFSSKPIISSNKEKVDEQPLTEEKSFEVTQEMLDKMKADFESYRSQKETQIKAAKDAGTEITFSDTQVVKQEESGINWFYIIIGVIVGICLVLIGIITYLVFYKNKKDTVKAKHI